MSIERSQIPQGDKWNVEAFYPSLEAWEKDLKSLESFASLERYKGTLGTGPGQLKEFFTLSFKIDRHLTKLYTYAHLRHDEDLTNDAHKQAYGKVMALVHEFKQKISWVDPEILQMPDEQLKTYLASDELKEFRIHLEKIIRLKPHTLSAEKEELCALAGKALATAHLAFSAFNNADLKFPKIQDSKGEFQELTHGKYFLYLRGQDRVLRAAAFKTLHNSFSSYENTLCELIQGEMQSHLFEARVRGYKSCLEAALFPHQIDPAVYMALIQAVRKHLGSLHRYVALRKKVLGVDEIHMYDLHVPLVKEVDFSMDFATAEKHVIASLTILGPDYQKDLEKGLLKDRWVDRYENKGKRSGAYSSGCYDSMPYILMNYQGTLNDVLTLTHEAGHSMHSLMSCRHQPYQYSHYPIFVAEVASTFHEKLLAQHLMKNAKTKEEKCYLINQEIESVRNTFFRQTMFAEFELRLHELVEKEIPLTPTLLKTEYRKLNQEYFGPDLVMDEEIDIEWARIPHFYYNYYVYQYATGISAAHALVEHVQTNGEKAREKYVQFLSSGSSRYPLDLLASAGVDMRKPTAVESIIRQFDHSVEELRECL
jgi:oligoendopeptidase F